MRLVKKIKLWFKKKIISYLLSLVSNNFREYAISLENKNDYDSKAILFGYNLFFLHPYYGSDANVIIETQDGRDYNQLLCESQLKTKIKAIRYFSVSELYDMTQCNAIYYKKSNGYCRESIPLLPYNYYKPGQYQTHIVDIEQKIEIDGNNYLEIILKPKQKIHLVLFNVKTRKKHFLNEED